MLFRFCLYGFLKNQKYYEPFLILAFREKGLSFFMIGFLIGFRQVCINLFEVPTGAIADLYGRRRSMIFSFLAYITSFAVFATSPYVGPLFIAMLLFAMGEAFRTGTHKAMIFDWLQSKGLEKQKTKYYGFTRSWSQMGSALSVLLAAAIVLVWENYVNIFWFSIIPYAANVINFLGYPKFLDGETTPDVSVKLVFQRLVEVLKDSLKNKHLRRLFAESMTFKGSYSVAKEYLQPLLKQAALALPVFLAWDGQKHSALLIGFIYFVLYLFSSLASRKADSMVLRTGGEGRASQILWWLQLTSFALLVPAFLFNLHGVAILLFVFVAIIQNLWRPILLSRIDSCSNAKVGATILSIDSQAESLFVMTAAPTLGLVVDHAGFWPVGVFGAVLALLMLAGGGHDQECDTMQACTDNTP